jgi:hypothetical protein
LGERHVAGACEMRYGDRLRRYATVIGAGGRLVLRTQREECSAALRWAAMQHEGASGYSEVADWDEVREVAGGGVLQRE